MRTKKILTSAALRYLGTRENRFRFAFLCFILNVAVVFPILWFASEEEEEEALWREYTVLGFGVDALLFWGPLARFMYTIFCG